MFCTKCGKQINENSAFCSNCGAPNALYKEENTKREKKAWIFILLGIGLFLAMVSIVRIIGQKNVEDASESVLADTVQENIPDVIQEQDTEPVIEEEQHDLLVCVPTEYMVGNT